MTRMPNSCTAKSRPHPSEQKKPRTAGAKRKKKKKRKKEEKKKRGKKKKKKDERAHPVAHEPGTPAV